MAMAQTLTKKRKGEIDILARCAVTAPVIGQPSHVGVETSDRSLSGPYLSPGKINHNYSIYSFFCK